MDPLATLATGLLCIGATAAGALLVYGGVWGVLRVVREQILNIDLRVATLERQRSSLAGQAGVRVQRARADSDDALALELRRAAELAASAAPPRQGPRLLVDGDGLVHTDPETVARARAEADAARPPQRQPR